MKIVRKILSFLGGFLEFLIVCYVIFVTFCILNRNKFGFTQFGDYTIISIDSLKSEELQGSNKGDLYIIKKTMNIKENDMIYYYAPSDEEYVIKTDVVANVQKDGSRYLYTVGTRGKTLNNTRVIGKYAKKYPKLGYAKDIVESRLGFLLLVLLPIMIIFIYQVYLFIIELKYDKNVDYNAKEESSNSSNEGKTTPKTNTNEVIKDSNNSTNKDFKEKNDTEIL